MMLSLVGVVVFGGFWELVALWLHVIADDVVFALAHERVVDTFPFAIPIFSAGVLWVYEGWSGIGS